MLLFKTGLFLIFYLSLVFGLFFLGNMKVVPCEVSCEGGHSISVDGLCSLYNPNINPFCHIESTFVDHSSGTYLFIWVIFITIFPFYLSRKIVPVIYYKITKRKFN